MIEDHDHKRRQGSNEAGCGPHEKKPTSRLNLEQVERAAALFRALGDPARLRLLALLRGHEACVSELAASLEVKLSTLSQQLRILHLERLVTRRREGKHVYYAIVDTHVEELIRAGLEHSDHDHIEALRLGEDTLKTDSDDEDR
jgi:ArsR family transcriptional regulator, lead/cadmium/zinc/bismuth-responsive transcriptional repressor